ncbi:hypothetical protein Leryth_003469 [Lithospermum erythrorhizon]|nr:hypothetical protein Leryth_003469 [Lithospermum erythrorhizon]
MLVGEDGGIRDGGDLVRVNNMGETQKKRVYEYRVIDISSFESNGIHPVFFDCALANAASGMAVHDDCKLRFLELKTKRTHRFIVFKIEEKQKTLLLAFLKMNVDMLRTARKAGSSSLHGISSTLCILLSSRGSLMEFRIELPTTIDPTQMGLDVTGLKKCEWKN